MAKSIPSSGAGAVRIILKNKDTFHFDLREKKEDNGKQSYLFDVYYENTTGTLNDTNLKKLCNYVVDKVNV